MNICAKCRHFHCEHPRRIWYDLTCRHPDHTREPAIDPVTGSAGYACENSLGMAYIDDDAWPYCRDVNTAGECPLFESTHGDAMAVRAAKALVETITGEGCDG